MQNVLRKRSIIVTVIASLALITMQYLAITPAFAQSKSPTINSQAYLASVQQLGEQQCAQPPQGVDLSTLSDTQLTLYGLPTHSEMASYAGLKDALSHAKQRTCGTSPSSTHQTHHFVPTHTNTQLYSSNWAGNVAHGSRGTYRSAGVTFHVPSLSGTGHVSFWAGVGGDTDYASTVVLVQDGIDMSRSSSGAISGESWWEVYPQNAEQNLPLTRLNPGDSIYSYVSSNLSNDGYDYFFLENSSAGTYNTHYVYTTSWFSDSAAGECIGERPTYNGSLTSLPNFGTERMYGCTVNGNSIGSVTHDYLVMEGNSGAMVTVGPIASNGTDFSLYWHASS